MKRVRILKTGLSLLLMLCLLAGVIPVQLQEAVSAFSEEKQTVASLKAVSDILTSGSWRYRKLSDGNAELLGYADDSANSIELPQKVDGLWVIRLAEYAFEGNALLRRVDIPASIGYIPNSAFPNCERLEVRAYNGTAAMSLASARRFTFNNRS